MQELDLLILGAGWTSTFLTPLLSHLSYARTSTTGRDGTIKFKFDPDLADQTPVFKSLPSAKHILLTFPVASPDAALTLLRSYATTHPSTPRWLVLGSTGVWQPGSPVSGSGPAPATTGKGPWVTRHSPLASDNTRAKTEIPFLEHGGVVLHLAGLYGGQRVPKNWLGRVAGTKDALRGKGGLHLIHGEDVARAIVAVVSGWTEGKCAGQRWMLTDGWAYDWWGLAVQWEPEGAGKWARELMVEEGVRALPRSVEQIGRGYDSREFWETFGLWPSVGRVE